jgi:hypothetical protein
MPDAAAAAKAAKRQRRLQRQQQQQQQLGGGASGVAPAGPPESWLVLGIESSCDDTAAAVVRGDGTVLSHCIASQVGVAVCGLTRPDARMRFKRLFTVVGVWVVMKLLLLGGKGTVSLHRATAGH